MRHLRADEVVELKRLREEGWKIMTLAKHFDVCTATVSNVLRGKTDPNKRKPAKPRVPESLGTTDIEEMNFKSLPDDVLFRHVRPWAFIG